MQMTCRWWKKGEIKRSLFSGSANQRTGLTELAAFMALWRAAPTQNPPLPLTASAEVENLSATPRGRSHLAAALQPRRAGRGGLGCQRPSRRWRRARGLAGARKVSAVPQLPPIPWPAQSPMRTAHRSPGGHKGQRRSEPWGMANRRLGAAGWAPRPSPGDNQGSAEGNRNPSPRPRSPGLEPSVQGSGYDVRPFPKSLYSKPGSGSRSRGCKDGAAALPPACDSGQPKWGPPPVSFFPALIWGHQMRNPLPFFSTVNPDPVLAEELEVPWAPQLDCPIPPATTRMGWEGFH